RRPAPHACDPAERGRPRVAHDEGHAVDARGLHRAARLRAVRVARRGRPTRHGARARAAVPAARGRSRGGRRRPAAWMGIQSKQAADEVRTQQKLADGAASVVAVYPDSPAKTAGLQAGDIVTGPPGKPFTERDQIREWTMLSTVDKPASLA